MRTPLVPVGIVLDTSALTALVTGSKDTAYLVDTARDYHRSLYCSANSLYQVDQARGGAARAILDDSPINPVSLDPASATEMAETLPEMDIAAAHVIHLALPGRSWPAGRAVATTKPALYEPYEIAVVAIDG